MGTAHNHPYGCTCNWCNNYLGKGGGCRGVAVSSPLAAQSLVRVAVAQSSDTMQTCCPHCQMPVWFHRAWNGGCAWFDELGAPWQIHECFQKIVRPPASRPAVRDSLSKHVTRFRHRECRGFVEASVIDRAERPAGDVLLVLWRPKDELLMPMLAPAQQAPHLGPGWVGLGTVAGVINFESQKGQRVFQLCGPVSACWNVATWLTSEGGPADRLALGRDLGINRLKNFNEEGVRYVAPQWREALGHYLPALFAGDEIAMAEVVNNIEHAGKGVLSRAEELELIRLHRKRVGSVDSKLRDAIYEAMLEALRV